jgi:hypothetical protein
MQNAIRKRLDAQSPNTTNNHFANLQQTIQQEIQRHEKTPKQTRRKPWCNPKIKRMIRKQHRLHERRKKEKTPDIIKQHASYRKQVNRAIIEEKKQHLTQTLAESKHNPKQQAKILKSVISKNKQSRESPTTIQYEGKTYTAPSDIANALNDHFITVGAKTSAALPPKSDNDSTLPEPAIQPPQFMLERTTQEEIAKLMRQISPEKASDLYNIKPRIIKDLHTFLSPILTQLFNKSIDESEYPDSLKGTKLIELEKSQEPSSPENYRPISLLPIIAKLFDTLLNNQIMKHLTKYAATQYAFRPNSNTTLTLQTILDDIHKKKPKNSPFSQSTSTYPKPTTLSPITNSSPRCCEYSTFTQTPLTFSNHT